MSLPPFDRDTGVLPAGEHAASWEEVVDRFGWNVRRRSLLDGLGEALLLLGAVGCRRVWLNGSFVTTKDEPADFDAVWDPDAVDVDALDPIFFELSRGRADQKARFGGELFPDWIERGSGIRFKDFFQQDRVREVKGIVVIDPRSVAP